MNLPGQDGQSKLARDQQRIPLQLGIVADEIDCHFGQAVATGTALGLRRYELRRLSTGRFPMCSVSELLEVERIVQGEGIELTAVSPGLFKHVSSASEFRREMKEVYPKAAEWALRFGLRSLIVFAFQKPGATEENGDLVSSSNLPEQVIEWMRIAAEQAQADGMTLIVEPEPICWADNWETMRSMIQKVGKSSLKINYDPGNVTWMTRRDEDDAIEKVKPWIMNVHVKDLREAPRGSGKPEFVPAGRGMINYGAHFAALQKMNYRGPISLEPHMDGAFETIRECVQAVKVLWESCCDVLAPQTPSTTEMEH